MNFYLSVTEQLTFVSGKPQFKLRRISCFRRPCICVNVKEANVRKAVFFISIPISFVAAKRAHSKLEPRPAKRLWWRWKRAGPGWESEERGSGGLSRKEVGRAGGEQEVEPAQGQLWMQRLASMKLQVRTDLDF